MSEQLLCIIEVCLGSVVAALYLRALKMEPNSLNHSISLFLLEGHELSLWTKKNVGRSIFLLSADRMAAV